MIKSNEVTWYSKLAAVVFFIGVLPALTFYIGTQYQIAKDVLDNIRDINITQSSNTNVMHEESKKVDSQSKLEDDQYIIKLNNVYKDGGKVYVTFYIVYSKVYTKDDPRGFYYVPIVGEKKMLTLEIAPNAEITAQSYSEAEYAKGFTTDEFLSDATHNKYWYNFTYPFATIKNNKIIDLLLSNAG